MSFEQLTKVPNEILLQILQYVSASDLSRCRRTCKSLEQVISASRATLQRRKANITLDFEKGCIDVEFLNNGKCCKKALRHTPHILAAVKAAAITFFGRAESVEIMAEALITNRQTNVKSLTFERSDFGGSKEHFVYFRLCSAMWTKTCEQIVVKDAHLPSYLLPTLLCGDRLRQFTLTGSLLGDVGESCFNSWMGKKTQEIRHNTTLPIPFCCESPGISSTAICKFLQNWLMIPDASFFQIIVRKCQRTFMDEFLQECQRLSLSHVSLEFPSKAHPTAHVKAIYVESLEELRLFPIVDVPARVPGQYVCLARYYRDF
jgi:hypothetical protein